MYVHRHGWTYASFWPADSDTAWTQHQSNTGSFGKLSQKFPLFWKQNHPSPSHSRTEHPDRIKRNQPLPDKEDHVSLVILIIPLLRLPPPVVLIMSHSEKRSNFSPWLLRWCCSSIYVMEQQLNNWPERQPAEKRLTCGFTILPECLCERGQRKSLAGFRRVTRVIQTLEKLLHGEKFKKFTLFRTSKRWQRPFLITADKCSFDETICDRMIYPTPQNRQRPKTVSWSEMIFKTTCMGFNFTWAQQKIWWSICCTSHGFFTTGNGCLFPKQDLLAKNQCRNHAVSNLTLLLQDCKSSSGLNSIYLVLGGRGRASQAERFPPTHQCR